MWGCEDVRMLGCEDVRMWGCEDNRTRGREYSEEKMIIECSVLNIQYSIFNVQVWEVWMKNEKWKMKNWLDDVRMWGCEDVMMRGCDN